MKFTTVIALLLFSSTAAHHQHHHRRVDPYLKNEVENHQISYMKTKSEKFARAAAKEGSGFRARW